MAMTMRFSHVVAKNALRAAGRPSPSAISTGFRSASSIMPARSRSQSTTSTSDAKKQLLSLTEIDRLLTHIASESVTRGCLKLFTGLVLAYTRLVAQDEE